MNQKDYKTIAHIIREDIDICNKFVDELKKDRKTLTYKAMVMREIKTTLINQANSFSDYFEREAQRQCNNEADELNVAYINQQYFNKEQFLKDCGVK